MLKKAKELAITLTMLSAASVNTKLELVNMYAANLASINTIPVISEMRMIFFCCCKATLLWVKFILFKAER